MAIIEKLTNIADAIRAKTGESGTMTMAQMPSKIANIQTGIEPMVVTGTQVNNRVAGYIAEALTTYALDPNRTQTVVGSWSAGDTQRRDQPLPMVVSNIGSGNLIVYDSSADSVQKFDTSGTENVYNVSPDGGLFINTNGNIVSVGKIVPTGAERMIYAGSISNVRDIGGWTCDGGTIKYGLILRGGDIINASDAEKKTFVDYLRVKYEIDFGDNESASGFDSNVIYCPRHSDVWYRNFVDLENGNYLPLKGAIQDIFNAVAQNKASYFHCSLGADRTGTCAFIIEALLGMSEASIDIDYELTTFSRDANDTRVIRTRTDPTYIAMADYLKSCTNNPSSIRDAAVSWCLLAGISLSDINAFRNTIINGSPSNVTDTINYLYLESSSGEVQVGNTVNVYAHRAPSLPSSGITWTTSDSSVATVTASGGTATVTGVAVGNATITASVSTLSGTTVQATYSVSVTSAPRLPSAYQEVERIGNNANDMGAYLDIDYYPQSALSFDVDSVMGADDDVKGYIFGTTQQDNYLRYSLLITQYNVANAYGGNGNAYRVAIARGASFISHPVRIYGAFNSGEISVTMVKYDGTEYSGTNISNTPYAAINSMVVFGRNYSGEMQAAEKVISFHELKFSESGQMVVDLVACYRKSDGVIGMYDIVRNRFFSNVGSGSFIKGADVN